MNEAYEFGFRRMWQFPHTYIFHAYYIFDDDHCNVKCVMKVRENSISSHPRIHLLSIISKDSYREDLKRPMQTKRDYVNNLFEVDSMGEQE